MARNRFGGDAATWFVSEGAGGEWRKPKSAPTVTFWSGTPDDLDRVMYDDLRAVGDPDTVINSVKGLSNGTLPEFDGIDDDTITAMWASPDGGVTGMWIFTTTLSAVAGSGSFDDLDNKPTIPSTAADVGAVPTTRKVNGKALSGDVTLAAGDVGAATEAQGAKADTALQPGELDDALAPLVPTSSGSATAAALSAAFAAVLGKSNGTNDTTWLNAALAAGAGKVLRGTPGENYKISAPLVLKSGTTLDMTGCTVTLLANSNCNMLNNDAVSAARTVVDASMTSGSASLSSVTAAFTSADQGKAITVWGAGNGGMPLDTTILTVTDSAHVVLATNAQATVSNKAASIGARTTSFQVRGGTWAMGSNQGAGSNLHALRFRRADSFLISDIAVTTTAGKYAVSIADARDWTATRLNFSVASDGVHVAGPCRGFMIRDVAGTTGDDTVAVTPYDWAAYADTYGDVSAGVIEDVHPTRSTSVLVKVLGGNGVTCKGIRVRNVSGCANSTAAVWVGDDAGQSNTTGGLIDDVTLENIAPSFPNTNMPAVLLAGTNLKRINVNGVTLDGSTTTAMTGVVVANSTTVVDSLTIRDLRYCTVAPFSIGVRIDATVNSLVINGVAGTLANGVYTLVLNGANTHIGRAGVSNVVTSGGSGIVAAQTAGATMPYLEMASCSTQGAAWALGDLNIPCEVHFANITGQGLTNGILNLRASASVTVRGSGLNASATGTNIATGGSLRLRSVEYPVDLSLAGLSKNNGDMAYNTNASLACGVGPAVSNGTNWKNLYSGATY